MSISASDVKKLRDMTGAGMMDAKEALKETNGDFLNILPREGQPNGFSSTRLHIAIQTQY